MATCIACGYRGAADFRFCPECGAEAPAVVGAREQRKVVTVVFCDVTDSTPLGEGLDPEAFRAILARYFERMKAIVEAHGGVVEKFIGDAVMVVFGVPVVHEDDALRAVRAALEMRAALPELGVGGRIGVNTGEVVTGTAERLVTGDAVNVAARLEQAAGAGEILIGEETLRLTRDAVEVEAVAPLALKGKARPVPAFRLLAAHEQPERRSATPMIGRESELARLGTAFDLALETRSCELFTIVGEPGVGKSRLVREFLSGLPATVAAGRCPPYGDGVTYWPVIETLKQLRARPPEPEAAAAIASLLGENDAVAPAEEIAWAVRRTLETAAADQPLVVVFDDIQWGEQTFLDLVEHVALLSSGPVLLLCMTRTELTERRSGWPVALRLEPLADAEVQQLLPERFDAELRSRIERASGGNPLFVEEMVAVAAETHGNITVPATLRGLLAARLDQLEPDERRVLECAAVEGELFHRGAVRALAGGGRDVTPLLAALTRRDLIWPDRALIGGDDGFRFRHLLIRDAAYEALTKSDRVELHRRLAGWIEDRGKALVELDELAGYHLEQAVRYSGELGRAEAALAERAAAHLAAAGRRAMWRVDEPAAASLLERALELTRPLRLDVHLELDLAEVRFGGDPRSSMVLAEAAAERARAGGDSRGEALARVVAAECGTVVGTANVDTLDALARSAIPLLEQAGDEAGLTRAWRSIVTVAATRGRFEDMADAAERMLGHARNAGQGRSAEVLQWALILGPSPADDALRVLDATPADRARPTERLHRAVLLAMLGRFDEAWPIALAATERLSLSRGASEEWWLAEIAKMAGDHEAAARYSRRALAHAQERGITSFVADLAPRLARSLCLQGRPDEAEPLAQLGRRLADEDDIWAQLDWRQAQALVDSASGKHAEAERLAREAVAIADTTDGLNLQGEARCDLAHVLAAAGRTDEANVTLEQALDRYERKRNLAMTEQVRRRLAAAQATASTHSDHASA